ncbi:MAG: NAD(P)-dependent oxidoreductase [bacterium]
MDSFLVGVDAGGRSVRCSLVEIESGRVTTVARAWEPKAAVGAGFFAFDLDTDRCWRLVGESVRGALSSVGAQAAQVQGIAATGMRFSMVVNDQRGRVLFAVPNRDARAASEAVRLVDDQGWVFNERTGHWPSPIFMAPRLDWLTQNAPEVLARTSVVFSLSDWIGFKMTGETSTDPSQAGGTMLLDLATGDWAWDLIDHMRLPRGIFPHVRQSGTLLGTLTDAAAEHLGLIPGTPVAVGGADTQCGLLGEGVVTPGQLGVIAGSTTPLQLVTSRAAVDAGARTWTGHHVIPGSWVLESNAGAMGETLEWFARLLYPEGSDRLPMLLAEASRSRPGAGGMLSSLGAGVMNAREMSLPIGSLCLTHLGAGSPESRRGDIVRSILEGMAYSLKANMEQLLSVAQEEHPEVRMAGGMTRSRMWTQLACDVLGLPVSVSVQPGASLLGAAICAGTAVGVFSDLADGADRLSRLERLSPEPERARLYGEYCREWQRLREARIPADSVAANVALQAMMSEPPEPETGWERPERLRILATADLDETSLAELRSLGEVTYASYREALRLLTGDELVEELQGFNVFITEVDIVDAEALSKLPDLRVIAACRGRAVNVDLAACSAFGIPVLCAPGRNADSVADLTLAFMLMLSRKMVEANAFLRRPGGEAGDMGRQGQAYGELQGCELWNKTVGLVGLGAVGRAVARRSQAFGARLLVYDPYLSAEDIRGVGGEPAGLDELLAESDIVSLHAPATDGARGMIGAEQLARMKRGAWLINTARAALVDEGALLAALQSGHLGGAALDVFATEPPGADDPLLSLANVIATPHVGGNTTDVATHQGMIVAGELKRMVEGRLPLNVLNPEALIGFDWNRPQVPVDAVTVAALVAGAGPAVSDLQQEIVMHQPGPKASLENTGPPEGVFREMGPDEEKSCSPKTQMERILRLFVGRAEGDSALIEFAAKHTVDSHYFINDLGLEFYIGFRDGRVITGLGAPAQRAEVRMKAKAETLDGILTGRLSGNKAAMTGKLSFSGDVRLAMGMQRIQGELIRLYSGAREDAGGLDLGATSVAPTTEAPATVATAPAMAAGPALAPNLGRAASGVAAALREEMTRITEEMLAGQLITATGGNVSARIPGSSEVLITPSQLYKGQLSPGMMVRIDLEGNALDPDALAPSSERQVHCEIYKARPDVEAVIHAHATYATILMMANIPFLPISTEAAFLSDIPRVPFLVPGSQELAAAVRDAIGDGMAVFLQNHGLVVAASSLRHAASTAEVIERVSLMIWGCYAVGKKPPTLPKEILAMLREIGRMIA